jgi:uncharacterized damage-inducible protein DinB
MAAASTGCAKTTARLAEILRRENPRAHPEKLRRLRRRILRRRTRSENAVRIHPLAALLLVSVVAFAQESKPAPAASVAESVGAPWALLARNFVSLADAMPADRYGFAPTQGEFTGVRTFGEQAKHVACANYGFFSEIEGTTPPEHCYDGGPSSATTKAELMEYLRDSFAYGSRVAAAIDQKNMLDVVDGPYGGPRTKLGIAVLAIWHASDHYGQLVEYLRMNGVVPPASRPAPTTK